MLTVKAYSNIIRELYLLINLNNPLMKKLPIYLLHICAFLAPCSIHAQNIALGLRGGLSIPNLTAGGNKNPLNTGYKSRLGPEAAIFAEFKFSSRCSIQPMIEYSSQGGKKNGFQAFPTPDAMAAVFPPGQAPLYLYANYKSEAKLDYLMLPILAKFGWDVKKTPFRAYINVGPFLGYLVSAKQITSGQSQFFIDPAGTQALPVGIQSFDNTENIRNQLHKVNVGIQGSLGLIYKIGQGNLFIEGGGNYGFLNIQKGTANGKNNTGAATAAIGYSYWFNR
jgi:hypothetical protein